MQPLVDILEGLVREKLESSSHVGHIPHDRSLFDVGLTSLQVVDLVFMIEDRLDLMIPDEKINAENFHNLASMVKLIEEVRGASRRPLAGRADARV